MIVELYVEPTMTINTLKALIGPKEEWARKRLSQDKFLLDPKEMNGTQTLACFPSIRHQSILTVRDLRIFRGPSKQQGAGLFGRMGLAAQAMPIPHYVAIDRPIKEEGNAMAYIKVEHTSRNTLSTRPKRVMKDITINATNGSIRQTSATQLKMKPAQSAISLRTNPSVASCFTRERVCGYTRETDRSAEGPMVGGVLKTGCSSDGESDGENARQRACKRLRMEDDDWNGQRLKWRKLLGRSVGIEKGLRNM